MTRIGMFSKLQYMARLRPMAAKDRCRKMWKKLFLLACIFHVGCFEPVTSFSFLRKKQFQTEVQVAAFGFEAMAAENHDIDEAGILYVPLIQKYSEQYQFDWVLIMSMIRQESAFRPNAVSNKGAYGLMQIMPSTQSMLRYQLGMNETKSPDNNIRAGIFHLRSLYHVFRDSERDDRIRLALAAYNAGIARVLDARQLAAYLGNDPSRWSSVRDAMPLLSKQYYTLHLGFWQQDRPPNGYFAGWKETVYYVERIMRNYDNSVGTMAYTTTRVFENPIRMIEKKALIASTRQGGQVSD
ncbi:MAG: transglycosylase SLT domain-containing protein [Ignavibacteriales bacterium]|nr:transglycosylase SLT domain-containing protein [Ignavibacteriales bacterium]